MKEELRSVIEQLKDENYDIENANALDTIYSTAFKDERNAVCDTIVSEIDKDMINARNVQDKIIEYSEVIKELVEKRVVIENKSDKNSILERAKINAKIDALSSISSYFSTYVSEIARNSYIRKS